MAADSYFIVGSRSKDLVDNVDDPYTTMDTMIREQAVGISIFRINATHCLDMLASESQRDEIGAGKKI